MDHRAEDLTRLRSEMGTLRRDRQTFVQNIRQKVADLLAGFAAENQAAHQAWAGASFASAGTTRGGRSHNPRKTQ